MSKPELLEVNNLSISFTVHEERINIVDSVSLKIKKGKTLALVGESGCGKSVTASSLIRLLPEPIGKIDSGEILFKGEDILLKSDRELYKIRGGKISMIFQEPMTAMNPVQVSGDQIREVIKLHRSDLSKELITDEMIKLLKQVEMQSPVKRLKNYPFQLSGGMRQRMMIAMALAGEPDILIADEPTTALDVTVQAQVLSLIKSIQNRREMGVLFITHDMGVVSEISDEVAVMYAGQIVEIGTTIEILTDPKHPYTMGLIDSIPKLNSTPKTHLPSINGSVPTPKDFIKTCRFAPRCKYAIQDCFKRVPELLELSNNREIRCILGGDIK